MSERPKAPPHSTSAPGTSQLLDIGAAEPDAFFRDVQELADVSESELEQLAAALSTDLEPPAGGRERMLAALPSGGRFERFADSVAQLLDIEPSRAARLLDQLDNRELYHELMPGIALLWVNGGPRVADAVRGFVRIAAGLTFPEHEHLGQEQLLVLQGSFVDPSRNLTLRPGDLDSMPAGSSHLQWVPEQGTDLLVLSVIQKGVKVGDQTFLPNQVPAQND